MSSKCVASGSLDRVPSPVPAGTIDIDRDVARLVAGASLGIVLGVMAMLALAPSLGRAEDSTLQGFFRANAPPPMPRAALPQPSAAPGGFLSPLVRQFAPVPRPAALPAPVRLGIFPDDETARKKPLLRPAKLEAGERKPEPKTSEKKPAGKKPILASAKPAPATGSRAVCVRVCDGYYFPLDQAAPDRESREALCQAACPTAAVRLYTASGGLDQIDHAVGPDGAPYSSLPTAHAYRRESRPSCACRVDPTLRGVSLLRDYTLRRGDAVVVDGKALVFKGATNWPWRAGDFAEFRADSAGLAATEKGALDSVVGASRRDEMMRGYRIARRGPPRTAEAPVTPRGPSTPVRRIDMSGAPPAAPQSPRLARLGSGEGERGTATPR